jgi:hypothetical protein
VVHLFPPRGVGTTPYPEGPPGRVWQIVGWLRRIQGRLLDAKADIARTVLHGAE